MSDKQLPLTTFEQSKLLKQIGFDWEVSECFHKDGTPDTNNLKRDCNHIYDGNTTCVSRNLSTIYSRPTVSLALKWFRDIKGIFVVPVLNIKDQSIHLFIYDINASQEPVSMKESKGIDWDLASSVGLDDALDYWTT